MAETLAQRFVSTEIASLALTDAFPAIGDRLGTPVYGMAQITPLRDLLQASFTKLVVAGGTITADAPLFSGTQTWDNAGVTFTALKLDVTNTNSAAASLLLDLQVGSASKFNIAKNGDINIDAAIASASFAF